MNKVAEGQRIRHAAEAAVWFLRDWTDGEVAERLKAGASKASVRAKTRTPGSNPGLSAMPSQHTVSLIIRVGHSAGTLGLCL